MRSLRSSASSAADGDAIREAEAACAPRLTAEALVADVDLAPLSAELLAAATVGLGAAMCAASTRVADGYCDPVWYCVDPDCPKCAQALPEVYTCERWGQGSEGCAFFQAYEP